MSEYQALNYDNFGQFKWNKFTDYKFAKNDSLVPIGIEELANAVIRYPLAFVASGETYKLVAVLGLSRCQNLYVTSQGMWRTDYVPALYRSYPFKFALGEDAKRILCFDTNSGLKTNDTGNDFFDETGETSDEVKGIINFMLAREKSYAATDHICAKLAESDLIEPWPISLQLHDSETKIEGLYRINENSLNQLRAEQLADSRNSGCLSLAYAQLLSIQHLQILSTWYLENLQVSESGEKFKERIDFSLGDDQDFLSFDDV